MNSAQVARRNNIGRKMAITNVDLAFRLMTDTVPIDSRIPALYDPMPVPLTRDPFITDMKIRYATGEFA